MKKNTAGKWIVFAWTTATGLPKTGDAANITATLYIDGASNAVDDVNPTELSGGYYVFDVTATETNGDNLAIVPVSGTSGVQVIGVPGAVWTEAAYDRIGAAGAGLTAIPWNASWDAEVQSECTDALNAYDPPTKAEMDSGLAALNDITVADILAGTVEGSITLVQALRLMLAVLTGKSSGGGTGTIVFRDTGDTKNRISATVDSNGNRTAVGTRDGS